MSNWTYGTVECPICKKTIEYSHMDDKDCCIEYCGSCDNELYIYEELKIKVRKATKKDLVEVAEKK